MALVKCSNFITMAIRTQPPLVCLLLCLLVASSNRSLQSDSGQSEIAASAAKDWSASDDPATENQHADSSRHFSNGSHQQPAAAARQDRQFPTLWNTCTLPVAECQGANITASPLVTTTGASFVMIHVYANQSLVGKPAEQVWCLVV